MALMNCPECTTQVSDKAPTCPKCGAPIASRQQVAAIGIPTVVQEQTAKSLKMRMALTTVVFFGFVIGAIATKGGPISIIGLLLCLIYLAVLKFRAWWHHG